MTKPENGRQLRNLLEVLVAETQALAQCSGFSPAGRQPTLPRLDHTIDTEVTEIIKAYDIHAVAVVLRCVAVLNSTVDLANLFAGPGLAEHM